MIADFSPQFHVLVLPCGCLAEMRTVCGMFVEMSRKLRATVLECPWCGATFLETDFHLWLTVTRPGVLVECGPRTLLRLGDQTLEFMRHCDCGAPVVRDFRGRSSAYHLLVPACSVERLMN